LIFTPCGKPVD